MTIKDHLLAAEAQMLMADSKITPHSEEERISAQLHTAMFHLEAALAIAEGREPRLPEPEPLHAL